MNSGFGNSATLRAHPGRRDELEALLLRAFDSERMPGCHLYVVGRGEDPDVLAVQELWVDADAHAASLQLPHVRETIAEAMPLIAEVQGTRFVPLAGVLPD